MCTEGELVQPLCAAIEGVLRATQHAGRAKPRESSLRPEQLKTARTQQPAIQPLHMLLHPVLRGGEQLRSGRGRGSADVGCRVGDRRVRSMADAGDDGQAAAGNGARYLFMIEAVQILPGAPATRDQNDLGVIRMRVEPAQTGRDLRRAVRSLHGGWVDEQLHGGVPSPADLDDVPQRGPLQAGDDADAAGKRRQGALAIEETFTPERLFQALDLSKQRAQACLLHPLSDQLHLAAALVDGQLPMQLDGVAVARLKA